MDVLAISFKLRTKFSVQKYCLALTIHLYAIICHILLMIVLLVNRMFSNYHLSLHSSSYHINIMQRK